MRGSRGPGIRVIPSPSPEIAFLCPGLVHQFGNLLLTIQGQALTLTPESLARGKEAILTACERGGSSLRVVRHLLGDSVPDRAPLGQTLGWLAELLRIPVREAGHSLVCPDEVLRLGQAVELGRFAPMAVALVRTLVHSVPAGVRGRLDLHAANPSPLLAATFVPEAGGLPFPLATAAALPGLQSLARERNCPHPVEGRPNGFALLPALAGASPAMEA